uniref:Elongation of very long chain fatty acids protein n=1 Tax=Strigamia maritima TaxID=126957 RepID=T1JHG2_STRMM
METTISNISTSTFFEDMWELRDRRLDDYATMNSPLCVLMVCCFYVLFSFYIGPWLMENKRPYNIKPVIITYNTIMVVANGYIFVQGWRYGWSEYKLLCEPVDAINLTYAYYVTKYLDWFDTMFMILRKKYTHISILHLYHHGIMPLNSWMIVRYLPGGHMLFGGMLNTFVHVVMYTYYTLAALGPQMQKYLWWKRYITLMQMTQFIVGLIHMFLILTCDFDFPKVIFYSIFPQGFLFLILFGNFYLKTYTKKQPVTHSDTVMCCSNSSMELFYQNVSFSNLYDDIWERRDKRMDGYLFMDSPIPVVLMCVVYILFSLYIGPWFMKNRKPYNVKPLVIIFNITMTVVNAYILILGWRYGWSKYKWMCEPVDTSDSTEALLITKLVYYYFLTKLIDWIDTLLFIMRKKFNHVSILHVYHHCCMPFNIWPIVRFLPGGHTTFLGVLNTFVHIIMHSYYTMSAFGPKWQKFLWWKKYLTIMQIVQFVLIGLHFIYSLWKDCGFPRKSIYFYFPQVIIMCTLFGNFYTKAYKRKQK